jgi:hypothetical protein
MTKRQDFRAFIESRLRLPDDVATRPPFGGVGLIYDYASDIDGKIAEPLSNFVLTGHGANRVALMLGAYPELMERGIISAPDAKGYCLIDPILTAVLHETMQEKGIDSIERYTHMLYTQDDDTLEPQSLIAICMVADETINLVQKITHAFLVNR